MTSRLQYSRSLIRHHLGDLFYKCPNQWKRCSCIFVLPNVAAAIIHEAQIQMKAALSASELLPAASQGNAFQGNSLPSRVKQTQAAGSLGALQAPTTEHLMTLRPAVLCIHASEIQAALQAEKCKCCKQRSASSSSS